MKGAYSDMPIPWDDEFLSDRRPRRRLDDVRRELRLDHSNWLIVMSVRHSPLISTYVCGSYRSKFLFFLLSSSWILIYWCQVQRFQQDNVTMVEFATLTRTVEEVMFYLHDLWYWRLSLLTWTSLTEVSCFSTFILTHHCVESVLMTRTMLSFQFLLEVWYSLLRVASFTLTAAAFMRAGGSMVHCT